MATIDWMRITHPDDVQADLDQMALLNAGKIPGFQKEKRYLKPNGSVVWINMTIAPLPIEEKASPRHYCMIDDITERKRTEAALWNLKDFAHTISHELKAPLRGISGYTQELERKHRAGLSERAVYCLSQITTATGNLDHLIDDLLLFARLDAELPSLTAVNPRHLIEVILNDRSLLLAEQHTEVTVDLPSTTLRTWERGFVQVMTNLIDNALKYSRQSHPPRIGLRAGEIDGSWQFAVSDNGIGFDMKYHDRIFGLFNRLVRAEDFEGTGAGLAIVKKVLDKLGGTIRAEAQPGQGATFYVSLPPKK